MDYRPSAELTIDELELSTTLAQLGLSQYEERLRDNGFENWGKVTSIAETDMAELDFKLGDRRRLQRAIREYNSSNALHAEHGARNLAISSEGLSTIGENSEVTPRSSQQAARTTRSYRRHPRPDPNAPHKPKTAYVLFGEHVRQDPVLSRSSFAKISKETGRRWRGLSVKERVNVWEAPAADRSQEYKEELERYKQTENYRNHQTYLEEFKQQQQNPEPITLPDKKSLSTSESASFNRLPTSQDQDESEATRQESVDSEDLNLEGQSQNTTAPIKSGMEEVRDISKALGINPHLMRVTAFPQEEITTKAVEAFLLGTGSLLYLWNQDEASNLVKSVYHPQSDSLPVYATEVFAMSAVGSYCDGEAHTRLLQERFLHFFLYMLSSSSDMCDLRRMRLLACLATCRFTNSVQSARKLMLSALIIGRETFMHPSFAAKTSEGKMCYWRNVFRSVVFLESWFAYNTSFESRVTQEDLSLYHVSCSHPEHGPGVFQERVGELGQLAAYIALDLKTATQPRVAQAKVHFESLNEWHRTLPPPMQLSRLSLVEPLTMNLHTKRSVLQLHILFLGMFIEPYRNCLVDLARFRLSNTPSESVDLETLKKVEDRCVLAARQSARVASLLQTDDLIRSHCWVSVYTCFTGCAILLFSASQKLLELFGEEIVHDLSYASSHLNVLSFCSYDNPVARNLYITLQIAFNDIRDVIVSPVYRKMRELHVVVKDVALVPLSHYDAVEGAEEVSKSILDLTERIIGVLQESLGF